uniref:Glycosyl transferase family 28 C-terminal domain-containing protein n=1 Tax=Timspurckia oligopyrenoides TaxID=708627 RepID=A0A7S0ZKN8_9RHOD
MVYEGERVAEVVTGNVLVDELHRDSISITILYGSGGGGHKASAFALRDVFSASYPSSSIHLYDASKIVQAGFGDSLYNWLIQHSLSNVMPLLYSIVSILQPIITKQHIHLIKQFFLSQNTSTPDLVVSFVPFLNSALCEALPNTKHITVITDFTTSQAHPWMQHPRQILCCGTTTLYNQALALGYNSERVFRLSGMIVRPEFYQSSNTSMPEELISIQNTLPDSRDQERGRLTFLLLFGGAPSTQLVETAAYSLAFSAKVSHNVVCICGYNGELLQKLTKKAEAMQSNSSESHGRLIAVGFRQDIASFMSHCDVICTKPGPGVVAEALVVRKAALILLVPNGEVMPQERAVLQWVKNEGVGIVVNSIDELCAISREQIQNSVKKMLQMGVNRAVYELTEIVYRVATNNPVPPLNTERELTHKHYLNTVLSRNPLMLQHDASQLATLRFL